MRRVLTTSREAIAQRWIAWGSDREEIAAYADGSDDMAVPAWTAWIGGIDVVWTCRVPYASRKFVLGISDADGTRFADEEIVADGSRFDDRCRDQSLDDEVSYICRSCPCNADDPHNRYRWRRMIPEVYSRTFPSGRKVPTYI